jgi:hypothetical protein
VRSYDFLNCLTKKVTAAGTVYYNYDRFGVSQSVVNQIGGSPPNRATFEASLLNAITTTKQFFLTPTGLYLPAEGIYTIGGCALDAIALGLGGRQARERQRRGACARLSDVDLRPLARRGAREERWGVARTHALIDRLGVEASGRSAFEERLTAGAAAPFGT